MAEFYQVMRDWMTRNDEPGFLAIWRSQCVSFPAVASEILDAWLVGRGLEELDDPAAAYRRVTAEAVQSVAAEYLGGGRRAEGVVRGAAPSD